MTSTAVPIPQLDKIPCADFLELQDILKRLRTLDDKIIYELNTAIPTNSFAKDVDVANRCASLYQKLTASYGDRDGVIERCLKETQTSVQELRERKEQNPEDPAVLKQLRKQQTNLRLLHAERNVEEVVKDRTLKVFYERCRTVFKPS